MKEKYSSLDVDRAMAGVGKKLHITVITQNKTQTESLHTGNCATIGSKLAAEKLPISDIFSPGGVIRLKKRHPLSYRITEKYSQ